MTELVFRLLESSWRSLTSSAVSENAMMSGSEFLEGPLSLAPAQLLLKLPNQRPAIRNTPGVW